MTDLVHYDPFGATRYDSTGWASFAGNDAQPGDPTLSDHLGYVPRFALSDGSSWTTVGAAKAATHATMLKTAVRNGLISAPKPRALSPSLRSAERTAATNSLCSRDFYLSQSTCSFPNGVTYPSRTTRASAPTTAQAINCATDVKVGMASTQMAANDACGRAYANQVISTYPEWQQNLYRFSQGLDSILRPAVPLLVVTAGSAIGGGGSVPEVGIPATGRPLGAANVANAPRLQAQLIGEEIAGGHAFEKHVLSGEFPSISTQRQFASTIEDVIINGVSKPIGGGRTAYWYNGIVVIRNPAAPDGGTAFRPHTGYTYHEKLRKEPQ